MSPHAPLLEETARLANAIASDRMGRSYLLQREAAGSVPALIALLKAGAADAVVGAGEGKGSGLAVTPAAIAGDLQRQPTPPQKIRSGTEGRMPMWQ